MRSCCRPGGETHGRRTEGKSGVHGKVKQSGKPPLGCLPFAVATATEFGCWPGCRSCQNLEGDARANRSSTVQIRNRIPA
jgi:hypothetical protein